MTRVEAGETFHVTRNGTATAAAHQLPLYTGNADAFRGLAKAVVVIAV